MTRSALLSPEDRGLNRGTCSVGKHRHRDEHKESENGHCLKESRNEEGREEKRAADPLAPLSSAKFKRH